jgi:hypothetical protein
MNKNRKDQHVHDSQSKMGSRDQNRGNERNHSSESSGSGSVLGNKESFEHGSGTSDMARGMGSSSERGRGSDSSMGSDSGSSGKHGGGISNRGLDQERDEQSRLPERGRSQSEE